MSTYKVNKGQVLNLQKTIDEAYLSASGLAFVEKSGGIIEGLVEVTGNLTHTGSILVQSDSVKIDSSIGYVGVGDRIDESFFVKSSENSPSINITGDNCSFAMGNSSYNLLKFESDGENNYILTDKNITFNNGLTLNTEKEEFEVKSIQSLESDVIIINELIDSRKEEVVATTSIDENNLTKVNLCIYNVNESGYIKGNYFSSNGLIVNDLLSSLGDIFIRFSLENGVILFYVVNNSIFQVNVIGSIERM
jgi:lipopolysaccharide export system protein LptA